MATYPNFKQDTSSTVSVENGVEFDRASNGDLNCRDMWSAQKHIFSINHVLVQADTETLRTFCSANRAAVIDLLWQGDGLLYQTRLTKPLKLTPAGGGIWKASVELSQV